MLFSKFLSCERGNLGVGTAVMALPLMMAAGLALESADMNRVNGSVQHSLDAAAMAIAVKVPSNMTDSELEQVGREHFYAHLSSAEFHGSQMPVFKYYGLITDTNGVQHITVDAKYRYAQSMGGVFSKEDGVLPGVPFKRKSRISVQTGDPACVYALSRTAPRAVKASGNTSVVMDGCVVQSNSSADDAIYVAGSADIEADCVQTSGGVDATGGMKLDCGTYRENAWPLPDPFASVPEPIPSILWPNPKKKDVVVKPGRYRNLSLDGNKKLQPGIYYLEGDLSVKGDLTGNGVMIFMKDGGVRINGNANVSLGAQKTGVYAGILFMSSRTNTSDQLFNGTGVTDLNGYLYFPSSHVSYTGNNGTTSNCLRIVADTVEMSGSSVMKSDCSAELGNREALVSGPFHYTH